MSTFSREVYLKFNSTAASPTELTLTDNEISNIGRFNSIIFKNVTVPLTYYCVSEINNNFLFRENNTGVWSLLWIRVGNYNSLSFANEIKRVLEFTGIGTYSVTISPTTGCMTISVSGAANSFSISFNTGDRQREKLWGIIPDTPGATPKVRNPPNTAQINPGVGAATYNSIKVLPSIIVVNSRNKNALLYLTGINPWLEVTLQEGTYTRNEFASVVSSGLNIVSYSYASFEVSINNNGTLNITLIPNNSYVAFSISFTQNKSEIEEIWGVPYLTPGATYYIQNPPSNSQITNYQEFTTPCPVILWGPDQILVKSRSLQKLMALKNNDIADDNQNVILKVPVENPYFTQQIISSSLVLKTVQNSLMPKVIDFDITDEDGNSLYTNRSPCYLTLVVT